MTKKFNPLFVYDKHFLWDKIYTSLYKTGLFLFLLLNGGLEGAH